MRYRAFFPAQAAGANAIHWDLFTTASSGQVLIVESIRPIVSGAVAVVGTVAVDVFLTRTSAVGTGGTAATREGTDIAAATITALDGTQPAPAAITARLTPTGGATAGAVLSVRSLFTEETSAGAYTPTADMIGAAPVIVPEGSGLRVVQGSVASVGNIAWEVTFSLRQLNNL